MAGSLSAGSASPAFTSVWRMVCMVPFSSGIALDDRPAQVGDVFALLVGDVRLIDDELQRTAFLLVDVGDPGLELQGVAGVGHAVIVEGLLRMQDASEVHLERGERLGQVRRLAVQA